MLQWPRQYIKGALTFISQAKKVYNLTLMKAHEEARRNHPNPLARFGRKCFSQTDEDGITIEIVRRLGISKGTFLEFGVGDGTENNTLILLSMGWSGVWIGGQDLVLDVSDSPRLNFLKNWVTLENVLDLVEQAKKLGRFDNPDIVSLDLDGNDLYFAESMLAVGICPACFIVEYNPKFPPPIQFSIQYASNHIWQGDDYFGASLCSFATLFEKYGYVLVCCNAASGANAFFVKMENTIYFQDVPKKIEQIYSPPNNNLYSRWGHASSIKCLEQIIR
jgi:hypothetical protein